MLDMLSLTYVYMLLNVCCWCRILFFYYVCVWEDLSYFVTVFLNLKYLVVVFWTNVSNFVIFVCTFWGDHQTTTENVDALHSYCTFRKYCHFRLMANKTVQNKIIWSQSCLIIEGDCTSDDRFQSEQWHKQWLLLIVVNLLDFRWAQTWDRWRKCDINNFTILAIFLRCSLKNQDCSGKVGCMVVVVLSLPTVQCYCMYVCDFLLTLVWPIDRRCEFVVMRCIIAEVICVM